jgi:microcystin-dependent protein
MPSPSTPSQFCAAVPTANADLCTRLTRFFNIAQLLCDFFSWFLGSDGSISSAALTEISATVVPTGSYMYSAASSMGSGWLLCDGSEVSRTTYADLFAVIGTLHGAGDGSTTFALPDGRGRSLIGAGAGSAGGTLTNRDINVKYVGEETHLQTIAELVPHHHTWSGPQTRTEERGTGANNVWKNSLDDDTEDTGGGTPFNVVHPCLIAYLFIKA